jgi:hypothetical protein
MICDLLAVLTWLVVVMTWLVMNELRVMMTWWR